MKSPARASFVLVSALLLTGAALVPRAIRGEDSGTLPSESAAASIYARENLVAWCIVPFDSRKRGPEERAEMMRRLGIRRFAYDWRAEHVPQFDEEMTTLRNYGIELTAFWFPGGLNDEARAILAVLERHGIRTQLWVSLGPPPANTPEEQRARVAETAAALAPIVEAAARIGCKVGLYNHGGWFGEPANQLEVLAALDAMPGTVGEASRRGDVGIVYNLHHGHAHLGPVGAKGEEAIAPFRAMLARMLPRTLCINLNGMDRDGEERGRKILPLGQGELDLALLRAIRDLGWTGPVGILGHTMDDAEDTLRDNLDGLDWLLPQLDGGPAPKPKPVPRAGVTAPPRTAAPVESRRARGEVASAPGLRGRAR